MTCYLRNRPQQTVAERKEEVLASVVRLNGLLARGAVKPKIGPQGAIAFEGWAETDRRGVTDVCAYRHLLVIGSSLAKAAIARAELLAGRRVSDNALRAGIHSHDSGKTWGTH